LLEAISELFVAHPEQGNGKRITVSYFWYIITGNYRFRKKKYRLPMTNCDDSNRKRSTGRIMRKILVVCLSIFYVGWDARADDSLEIVVNILSKYRLSVVNVRTDVRQPGFRIKLDRGELVVNGVRQKQFVTETHYDIPWQIRFAGQSRWYWGSLTFLPSGSTVLILNTIRIREYLQGVLAGEFAAAPPEALKALAVLARTLVFRKLVTVLEKKRYEPYLIGDLTNDQVYVGHVSGKKLIDAVGATENLVITYYGDLIEPFWHSTCGTRFYTPQQLWDGPKLGYLKSFSRNALPACRGTPHFEWERRMDRAELSRIINIKIDSGYPQKLDQAVVLSRNGKSLTPEYFRLTVNRVLGWNFLKSNDYSIQQGEDFLIFKGFGLGHNVGLCQCEATVMAKKGVDFKSILQAYFSEIEIEPWSLKVKSSF
jgi:stage II sporulation protein D